MTAPTPLKLAEAHAKVLKDAMDSADLQLSCIRKLLVGRYVRRTMIDRVSYFYVVDARLAGSTVQLWGTKRKGQTKEHLIGGINSVEIVP